MLLLPTQATDINTRRTRQELLLRMLPALLGSVSYGSRRVQHTMDEAIALSLELGVDSRIFPFFYGRWINTQAVGRHAEALAHSEEFIQLAQLHGDAGATTAAHINAAWSAFNLAQFPRARQLLTKADAVAKKIRKHGVGFAYAADAIVGLESCRVQTLWWLGAITQCREASARAIARSEEIKNSQSIFLASQYAGSMTHAPLREWQIAGDYGRAMIAMNKIAGARATGQFYSSLADMHLGQTTEHVDVALAAEREISGMGFKYLMPFWSTCIAEVVLLYGNEPGIVDELLRKAEAIVDKTQERWFWVEHMRLRALQSIHADKRPDAAAETFHEACELARQQRNASFGLRAAATAFEALPETRFRQHLEYFTSLFAENETSADVAYARQQLSNNANR